MAFSRRRGRAVLLQQNADYAVLPDVQSPWRDVTSCVGAWSLGHDNIICTSHVRILLYVGDCEHILRQYE